MIPILDDATLVTHDKSIVSKFTGFTSTCKSRIQSSTLNEPKEQFLIFGFTTFRRGVLTTPSLSFFFSTTQRDNHKKFKIVHNRGRI